MRKLLCWLLVIFLLPCMAARADETPLFNGDFSIMSELQDLPAGWFFDAWEADLSRAYMMPNEDGSYAVWVENLDVNDARVCQRIRVEPNTCYAFTAELSTEGVYFGARAGISVLDTFASSEPIHTTNGWETVTLTGVTGPKQDELILALRVGGYGALTSGAAAFRNITMAQLERTPVDALSFVSLTQNADSIDPVDPVAPPKAANEVFAPIWGGMLFVVALCAAAGALVYALAIKKPRYAEKKRDPYALALAFVAAFLLRTALSLLFTGHATDISCFIGWSSRMADVGPAAFYSADYFADYPPGYMLVLWLIGALGRATGLSFHSPAYILLLKLPSIIAEFFTAYLAYRLAQKEKLGSRAARMLPFILLFHPVFAFISGGWGQIDSLLTLCLIGALYLFTADKRVLAGAVYGLAILLKPQALMLGPLLAFVYLLPDKKKAYHRILLEAGLAVLSAVGTIALLALPFSKGLDLGWLTDKYFLTATSYPYASVEAFNLFALLGGNWSHIDNVPFLFSYGTWGAVGIVLSVAAACMLYFRMRNKDAMGALYLACAFLFAALFTLGPYMHERYLYPALVLLLFAAIRADDRRLYISFFWLSATLLLNTLCAFYIVDHQFMRGPVYDVITRAGSFAAVAGFLYLTYVCYCIAWKSTLRATAMKTELPGVIAPKKPLFQKKDHLFCWGVTALYAFFALTNLGVMSAPETEYVSHSPEETAIIELDGMQDIAEIWVFSGIAHGTVRFSGGGEVYNEYTHDDMFRWKATDVSLRTDSIRVSLYSGELRLREIVLFDKAHRPVTPKSVPAFAAALFDEQDTVPEQPSYLNGMYFDELYHARTAYEHINLLDPYETTHPPLGKVFIMLGIALFGMNAFGWRIIGTLFGIAMVPMLYAFGKRLFHKAEYALLCAVLFAFDFMHFTQTRIATVDVYAVFFIILMFYFMYQYITMNFFEDGFNATLRPLGLAGLCFGLGAASKWICIYAGLGLACMLFFTLIKRFMEYREAMKHGGDEAKKKYGAYPLLLVKTLLWCCVFYIAVPVVIYTLSYTPHFMLENGYGFEGVWENQLSMWNYHSKLTATHPYQSAWYSWPFTLRPMWYYYSDYVRDGFYSSITASGNPAVWWVCSVGAVALLFRRIYMRLRNPLAPRSPAMTMLLVGVLANFLPWVLVTRCTFIYHFFATVPFIILCSVSLLQELEEVTGKYRAVKWVWMWFALLFFVLMYPGISGFEVSASYAQLLKLLPGGGIFYGV